MLYAVNSLFIYFKLLSQEEGSDNRNNWLESNQGCHRDEALNRNDFDDCQLFLKSESGFIYQPCMYLKKQKVDLQVRASVSFKQ